MKLSELHYVELLYETRQSIAAKDVNLVYYLQEIERRLSAGEEAVKKVAELEQEMSKVVFYACYKREMEAGMVKIAELEKEVERLEGRHCADCCCDKSWKALGITEYTGKSIPEHIAELRQQAAAGQIAVDAMEKFSNKYKQWVSDYPKVVQKSKFFDDLIEMLQHKEAL